MGLANPAPPKTRDIDEPRIESTSVMTFARDCQSQTIHIDDSVERELVALPPGVVALLKEILATFAAGKGISLMPMHAELSPEEAANLLFVPRPYFKELLDTGEIPFRQDRSLRWVRMDDLMAYKTKNHREREAILAQMIAEAEELGLYD